MITAQGHFRVALREHHDSYPTERSKRSAPLALGEGGKAAAFSEGEGTHPDRTARAAASHGQGRSSAECYRKTKLEVEIS